MPEKQWKMQGDYEPWYIRFQICDETKNDILQQFCETPFFLPETSTDQSLHTNLNWKGLQIFMGTPGLAAQWHIDDVRFPSWQAQVFKMIFF